MKPDLSTGRHGNVTWNLFANDRCDQPLVGRPGSLSVVQYRYVRCTLQMAQRNGYAYFWVLPKRRWEIDCIWIGNLRPSNHRSIIHHPIHIYIYIYISTPNINTQRSMVLFTFAQGTRTHLKCNMVSKVFPRLPRVSNQNSKLGLISKCRTRYTGIFCQFTVHLTKNQLLRAYWRHNKTKRGIYRYCHGIPLFGKNNFS